MKEINTYITENEIDEKLVKSVETKFLNQFKDVFNDYNLSVDENQITKYAIPTLWDYIIELCESEGVDESIEEYVTNLHSEFGNKAGRYNIIFISGMISGEYPETEIGKQCRDLYKEMQYQKMS